MPEFNIPVYHPGRDARTTLVVTSDTEADAQRQALNAAPGFILDPDVN